MREAAHRHSDEAQARVERRVPRQVGEGRQRHEAHGISTRGLAGMAHEPRADAAATEAWQHVELEHVQAAGHAFAQHEADGARAAPVCHPEHGCAYRRAQRRTRQRGLERLRQLSRWKHRQRLALDAREAWQVAREAGANPQPARG